MNTGTLQGNDILRQFVRDPTFHYFVAALGFTAMYLLFGTNREKQE